MPCVRSCAPFSMAKKYADGLPLARQEKIWAREGVELSRATMANWVIQCAQTWLKPLYRHMKQRLLEQEVIHADETVIQVLKEDGKPASSESRMWVYGSGERSATPIRLFEYQPDRSGKRPEGFLRGFTKKLETAMKYAQNQRGPLSAFIDDGDVPISNNLAENAIRPFAVGRKNWLFCDTTKGAEASDIVYSIVETAKANGIDPYNYLLYVLSVLPYYGKPLSHELLEAQMPWSGEVQSRYGNVARIATE